MIVLEANWPPWNPGLYPTLEAGSRRLAIWLILAKEDCPEVISFGLQAKGLTLSYN